jgi:hypothetical protein
MTTMVDEIFDRAYRDGRAQFHASMGSALSQLANAVNNAFQVLNRIEYSAPWAARQKRARCN